MAPDLILFTSAYPFGNEEYFLETEIPFLADHFKHILIVPATTRGTPRPIPANITLDLSYAARYPQNKLLNYLKRALVGFKSPLFYQYREGSIRHRLAFFSKVETARQWMIRKLAENPSWQHSLLYTYWFYAEATALSWIKKNLHPHLRWISRAHGFDLAEENYPWKVIPARQLALSQVDQLYCISTHGCDYLKKKYAYTASLSKLGVKPSSPSQQTTGVFRLVSCSSLIPLKRVDLIIESIALFASRSPHANIEWHHFGGGPLRASLEKKAIQLFPSNVSWTFHGQVPNSVVLSFYQQNSCSLFILLSETEGIPVAIMEAQAASIPIVATNVGGIAETVQSTCGRLLPPHPSPDEVASILIELYDHPSLLQSLKEGSFKNWNEHHNALINYPRFCQELPK